MTASLPGAVAPNVAELVAEIARQEPDRRALTYLDVSGEAVTIDYAELWRRATAVGQWLADRDTAQRPVLLLYEPGIEFAVALLACLASGAIAVPAPVPTFPAQRARLGAILRASKPVAILSTRPALARLDIRMGDDPLVKLAPRIATEDLPGVDGWTLMPRAPDEVTLLQYTSGSTSEPKGIAITQANLTANAAMIAAAFEGRPGTRCLSWVPHTHDMGLIGGVIAPLATRSDAFLMAPTTFLRRPLRWLKCISENRIEISGGPDFAYALLANRTSAIDMHGLDLSHWRIAYVGAEPVRARTLTRFAEFVACTGFDARAFMPCYGLAEATVLVTSTRAGEGATFLRLDRERLAVGEAVASDRPDALALASCGMPVEGTMIRILDPKSGEILPKRRVGEICVVGPQVTFQGGQAVLRTGELGFMDERGLVVVDRLKDVLVLNGQNHACQDVEATAASCWPPGAIGDCAAILLEEEEPPRLVILTELASQPSENPMPAIPFAKLRATLFRSHGLGLSSALMLPPNGLPRTTSGKLQRAACKTMLRAGKLAVVAEEAEGAEVQR